MVQILTQPPNAPRRGKYMHKSTLGAYVCWPTILSLFEQRRSGNRQKKHAVIRAAVRRDCIPHQSTCTTDMGVSQLTQINTPLLFIIFTFGLCFGTLVSKPSPENFEPRSYPVRSHFFITECRIQYATNTKKKKPRTEKI